VYNVSRRYAVKSWEYDTYIIENPSLHEKSFKMVLNEFGLAGWEVCGTLRDGEERFIIILKRPKE
jgi:hypothetical protein